MTSSKLTHAQRMAPPPAEYMSPETFGGTEHGGVLYAGEYTWAAIGKAALRWAAQPDTQFAMRADRESWQQVPADRRVELMHLVLARSGVTDAHLQAGGYLTGWLSYLRQRWASRMRAEVQPAPQLPASGNQYAVASPDPLFTDVRVRPYVRYTHTLVIDGVEWSLATITSRMQAVEECDSDRGFASFGQTGEDAMLAQLLERHAGLKCQGGYHSAPTYDETKWQAFKERLAKVAGAVR